MSQLHKRFNDERIRVLFQGYCQGQLSRADFQGMLGIGKTRFFAWLKKYRQAPDTFTIEYQRSTHGRLSAGVEAEVERALLQEKAIIENPDLPVSTYNYSAIKDRLSEKDIQVSLTTIIKRAKKLGCYKPRKKRKAHDREVLTASIGALINTILRYTSGLRLPKTSGISSHRLTITAASCCLLTSSLKRQPGPISRQPRTLSNSIVYPCVTTWTRCECSALCKVEIVSGVNMFWKPMMWIPNGVR